MDEVVLEEPRRLRLREAPPPVPGPDEALVRVRRIGVCGTDLHAYDGRMPFVRCPRVLGHELAVEVLSAPPNDRGISVGALCAVEPYLACGSCHTCRSGRPNCCAALRVLGVHCDGGMREQMAVPVDRLHASQRLAPDQLALVETLGIGAHAVARSGVGPSETALIVGLGPIGLATLQFAMNTGARVRAMEIDPTRRAWVAGRFGVAVLAERPADAADVVFDATGHRGAMEASFDLVAFGGRLVFVGLTDQSITFDNAGFHRRELTLLATRNSHDQFPRIMQMIETGRIDTAPWITHRMSLREVCEQLGQLPGTAGVVKAMIEVG